MMMMMNNSVNNNDDEVLLQDYFDQLCDIEQGLVNDDVVLGDHYYNVMNDTTSFSTMQQPVENITNYDYYYVDDQSLVFEEQLLVEEENNTTPFYAQDLCIYDYDFSELLQ